MSWRDWTTTKRPPLSRAAACSFSLWYRARSNRLPQVRVGQRCAMASMVMLSLSAPLRS